MMSACRLPSGTRLHKSLKVESPQTVNKIAHFRAVGDTVGRKVELQFLLVNGPVINSRIESLDFAVRSRHD